MVPDTIRLDSYFESNQRERNSLTFTTIPMQFLFREKYSDLNDTDKFYGFISAYDKTSSANKKQLLESLIIKKDNIEDNDNDNDINDEINLINSAI